MNPHKKQLIIELVLPALQPLTVSEDLINSLYELCSLHQAVKFQLLELPGPYHEGRLWFSIDTMVQAYYFCPYKKCKWGTRIWKKREFILNSASLLNQAHRTDYLEILEPGDLISIAYVDLLRLMADYPALEKPVQNIATCNERYYHDRNQLLNRPPMERVIEFEKENPLFIRIAGKEAIAMHVGLTRQGYYSQLKKKK